MLHAIVFIFMGYSYNLRCLDCIIREYICIIELLLYKLEVINLYKYKPSEF